MATTPPPLPQLPSQIQVAPLQQPPPQGPPPQSGLMSYRQPVSAQIAQGLDSFMKSFMGSKDAMQQHYRGKFSDTMQQISLGTVDPNSLDMHKVAEWGRKGGLPLRMEAYTPEEKAYQAQQEQYETSKLQQQGQVAAAQGAFSSMPQGPTMQPQATPGMQQLMMGAAAQANPLAQAPGAPPQAPQPGLLQRLKNSIGMGRPMDPNSPAIAGLQNWAQGAYANAPMNPQKQGQQARIGQLQRNVEEHLGVPLSGMKAEDEMALMQEAKGALQNDPTAIQNLTRRGLLKGVPGDELAMMVKNMDSTLTPEQVWHKSGELQMYGQFGLPLIQHKLALAKDLIPRFAGVAATGGDPMSASVAYVNALFSGQEPTAKPNLTMEELKQQADAMDPMIRANPTTPLPVLSMYGLAKLTGNTSLEGQLGQIIGKGPRNGTMEEQRSLRQFGLDQYKATAEITNARDQLSLNTLEAILRASGQEGEAIKAVLNDKDASNEQKMAALSHAASLSQKLGQVKIPIPGRTGPDGKPLMYTVQDPQTVQGNLNWLQQSWTPKMPYLAPQGGGQVQVPGQQRPGQFSPPTPQNPAYDGMNPEMTQILQFMQSPAGATMEQWVKQGRRPADDR